MKLKGKNIYSVNSKGDVTALTYLIMAISYVCLRLRRPIF